MKLEVGQFVRTNDGIKQIYRIDNNKTKWKYVYKLKEQDGDGCINCGVLCIEDIIGEPSFKPIDLVQVGDYVNGSRVIEIYEYDGEKYVFVEETEYSNANQDDINICYKNEYIETILTKEEFEARAYRIGE